MFVPTEYVTSSDFNPRSPCGERLLVPLTIMELINFNPRSPCGERQATHDDISIDDSISIHAPRVGSDSFHFV